MPPRVKRRTRLRGSIDVLPSGTLRVRLYAGQDPLTKKRHQLVELIPAGPLAEKQAQAALDRMQREVADRTAPRTDATVDQLLERYLEQFAGGENTLELYRGHIRNHISPLIGHLKVGKLTPETLDAFYAELRRCRTHCGGKRRLVDHRVKGDHECDGRCRPHKCRPLAPTTVRHVHFILSGAYKRAVRWRWVSVSPTTQVDPPPAPKPNPQPPSAQESARIINAAWWDPDWGAFLWVAMTTGARRGELCAIRRSSLNLEPGRETIWLKRAIRRSSNGWVEGDLKTHQQRRIALDPETVDVLREHMVRSRGCLRRARVAGQRVPVLRCPGWFDVRDAGQRHAAVRPHGDAAWHRHNVAQAPALLGHRADCRGRRSEDRRRPTGSRRRRNDDPAHLYGVGVRVRPTSRPQSRRRYAAASC